MSAKLITESETEFFTPDELAKRCRISKQTAAKWRWNGCGPPYVKLGSRVLYRASDVDTWIEENVRTCTTDREDGLA